MARGRMINKKVCEDARFVGLCDCRSKLSFILLITFTDRDGRVSGSPKQVAGMLYPYDDSVTSATMATYMKEWAEAGLVLWYQVNGIQCIQFPAFHKNQTGLRYETEQASTIPAPSHPDAQLVLQSVRQSVQHKLLQEEKGKEGKRREENMSEVQLEQFAWLWDSWPAGRKGGKEQAMREWAKLNVDADLNKIIMDALDWFKMSKQWRDEDGRFVPHLSTWLHQKRWEGIGKKKKVWSDI